MLVTAQILYSPSPLGGEGGGEGSLNSAKVPLIPTFSPKGRRGKVFIEIT